MEMRCTCLKRWDWRLGRQCPAACVWIVKPGILTIEIKATAGIFILYQASNNSAITFSHFVNASVFSLFFVALPFLSTHP